MSLQSQTFHDLYLRFFGRGKIPLGPIIEKESHPELYAISGMEQDIGEEQKTYSESEILRPAREILEKGPLNFFEAYKWGIVDDPMYHQDLLAMLAEAGVKTWSVRKYLDSVIAQGILGDIDKSKWVIPQFLRPRKEGNVKEKHGKGEAIKRDPGLPGMKLDFSLVATTPEPKFEDTSIKLEVIIPRLVGLVYLDNAIEGYK